MVTIAHTSWGDMSVWGHPICILWLQWYDRIYEYNLTELGWKASEKKKHPSTHKCWTKHTGDLQLESQVHREQLRKQLQWFTVRTLPNVIIKWITVCCDTGISLQIRRLTSGCIASFLSVLYTLSEHGCSYPHAGFVSPVYPRLRNPQDKQGFFFCFFISCI